MIKFIHISDRLKCNRHFVKLWKITQREYIKTETQEQFKWVSEWTRRSVEWMRLMAGVTEAASSPLGIIVYESYPKKKPSPCLMVNNNNVLSDYSTMNQAPVPESCF